MGSGVRGGRGVCLFVQVPVRAGARCFERPGNSRTPAAVRDAGTRDLAHPRAGLLRISGRDPSSPLLGFSEGVGRCPSDLRTLLLGRIFLEPLRVAALEFSRRSQHLDALGRVGLAGRPA